MSAQLGPPLIQLFAPRPPLRYLAPSDSDPEKRCTTAITGIADYVSLFGQHDPDYKGTETFDEAKKRRQAEKKQRYAKELQQGIEDYNPNEDTQVRGDPYKTLFVSRLSYEVTEDDLQREFGRYGPIERVRIVRSKKDDKPRGYAFLVFEREKDMKAAYKETDGLKIRERRILVDVERGRTVKHWKPTRLGGGLGGRQKLNKDSLSNGHSSAYRGPPRPMNDRGPPRAPAYGGRREDSSRDRNGPARIERDRGDRGERNYDRGERGLNHGSRPHEPSGDHDRYSERPRQSRQGIGFERPPDMRSGPPRSYHDSHIGFTPSSHQPPLDPRARQPPTTYQSSAPPPPVPSAPSAPWLANASGGGSGRERPAYEDDRDYKRRRY